jgi:hypothetical protein
MWPAMTDETQMFKDSHQTLVYVQNIPTYSKVWTLMFV